MRWEDQEPDPHHHEGLAQRELRHHGRLLLGHRQVRRHCPPRSVVVVFLFYRVLDVDAGGVGGGGAGHGGGAGGGAGDGGAAALLLRVRRGRRRRQGRALARHVVRPAARAVAANICGHARSRPARAALHR